LNSGLSTLHNSTVSSVFLSSGLFWCNGSKLKVNRNYVTFKHDYSHKRGKVTGFSYHSRRNMLDKMARIDRHEHPFFVTLTFADEHKDNGTIYKHKDKFRAFRMRLDRRYNADTLHYGAMWRLEFKNRKSGRYVDDLFPHYHLLVWGIDDLYKFRAWVAINWYEVCGEICRNHLDAGTGVERVRNVNGSFAYASKYLGKVDHVQGSQFELIQLHHEGRVWGTWNPENIPFVKGILMQLNEKEAVTLIRYMRRYANLKGYSFNTLSIFCNVNFWFENLPKILANSS
jgi:hypothetical protein